MLGRGVAFSEVIKVKGEIGAAIERTASSEKVSVKRTDGSDDDGEAVPAVYALDLDDDSEPVPAADAVWSSHPGATSDGGRSMQQCWETVGVVRRLKDEMIAELNAPEEVDGQKTVEVSQAQ